MSTAMLSLPGVVEVLAVTGGAMTGALHAVRQRMDLMGVALVSVVTGVGGGATRDVLLGQAVPVFLIRNFIGMAIIGAIAGYFFARLVRQLEPAIFVMDTLLIGAWVVIGAEKALALKLPIIAAIFTGLIASVSGGLIRDILSRQVPTAFMPGQWVGAAALAAAVVFVAVDTFEGGRVAAQIAALATASGLRVLSLVRGWRTHDALSAADRLQAALHRDQPDPTP